MSKILKYAELLVPNQNNPDEVFLRFDIPILKQDIEDGDLDLAVVALKRDEVGLSEPEILKIGLHKFLLVSINHGIEKLAEARKSQEIAEHQAQLAAKQEARIISAGLHPDFGAEGNPRVKEGVEVSSPVNTQEG